MYKDLSETGNGRRLRTASIIIIIINFFFYFSPFFHDPAPPVLRYETHADFYRLHRAEETRFANGGA